jgi:integrase
MGKYKFGKPNMEIEPSELRELLTKDELFHFHAYKPQTIQKALVLQKSYVAILYWVGARRSEPLEVVKEDITLNENKDGLLIDIPAFKGGLRSGSIELPFTWVGVDLIYERWQQIRHGQKMWPFTSMTGYRIVKGLWPTRSPHWLRHNLLTKMRSLVDSGQLDKDSIKSYTGIRSDRTIESYGMQTEEKSRKVTKVLTTAMRSTIHI